MLNFIVLGYKLDYRTSWRLNKFDFTLEFKPMDVPEIKFKRGRKEKIRSWIQTTWSKLQIDSSILLMFKYRIIDVLGLLWLGSVHL